jgi:Inner membrane component of T3SS, cytoplasmic domain/Bacterial regulatory protein, Fis family
MSACPSLNPPILRVPREEQATDGLRFVCTLILRAIALQSFDLASGMRVIVGSAPSCKVVVADASVAPLHVYLEVTDFGLRIRDLSLNQSSGTFFGTLRVTEAFMTEDGGEIRIGDAALRISMDGKPASVQHLERVHALQSPESSGPQKQTLAPMPLAKARAIAIEAFEQNYIREALRQTQGNVTKAAATAGIARRYFQKLRAKHDGC